MKKFALLTVLLVIGCSNITQLSVPVIRLHEDTPQKHEADPNVRAALANIQIPPRAVVYRMGHGVAPSGTRLQYFEESIFTAPCEGTFIFVDHDPELGWAHSAWVIFIPNHSGAKAVIVDGEKATLLPGHDLVGPSGEEFDSLWQELIIKNAPKKIAH